MGSASQRQSRRTQRGSTNFSLVVGINKPVGMSSHDVVNQCRSLFGERRCGHAGTLDPLACGVLPLCIGPATRLVPYLMGHKKTYFVRIVFGSETTTDDSEGQPTVTAPVPKRLYDPSYAAQYIASLVGSHNQIPPQYSAVKVQGKAAYKRVRAGEVVTLKPRPITIYEATLQSLVCENTEGSDASCTHDNSYTHDKTEPSLVWEVMFTVSKGTYIRSLAKDIGRALKTAAHVKSLQRTAVGTLTLDECVTLETLAKVKEQAACDPLRLLSLRYALIEDTNDTSPNAKSVNESSSKTKSANDISPNASLGKSVKNGRALSREQVVLYEPLQPYGDKHTGFLSSTVSDEPKRQSYEMPFDGELVGFVQGNRLMALYAYEADRCRYVARCVLSTGVLRG